MVATSYQSETRDEGAVTQVPNAAVELQVVAKSMEVCRA